MTTDCASCANYTSKENLHDYLARACGETYCGVCRVKVDPTRGAFIRMVQCHEDCRYWAAQEMQLAA